MKTLILGRTATGKDYLANQLSKKFGLKGVKSKTTRPIRFLHEDTHIFVNQETADKEVNKVAETKINGYTYYATEEDVEKADYYIIDPLGLYQLVDNMPETRFHIVYIICPDELRCKRFMERGKTTAEEFYERNNAEKERFDEFENILKNERKFQLMSNVSVITVYDSSHGQEKDLFGDYRVVHDLDKIENGIRLVNQME